MPEIRVQWTPAYTRRKRAILDDETRLALELAEEAIIVDPSHDRRRVVRPDGIRVDWNEPGVFVRYLFDGDLLLFVEFRAYWHR